MAKAINIITLSSGQKIFYTKMLSQDEKSIVVEIESKEGRIGTITIPKDKMEAVTEWQ